MTASNTFGRATVLALTNKSGGGVVAGDVVILDTANNDAFTTTTTGSATAIIGIATGTIASNALGLVLFSGYASLVNVNASVTRGHYGVTHTVAKQATDGGATRTTGTFCQFLTGGTTPDAIIFNPDLGGASLTNPMNAKGQMILGDTGGTPVALAAGTLGFVLTAAGAGAFPAWAAAPAPALAGVKAYHNTTEARNAQVFSLNSEDYDTDNFHFTSAAGLTGTVTKASGSPNIVGSGTNFTGELTVNQVISIPGTATEKGVVKTITDNTNLVLWQNMANNASGQTATRLNSPLAIPAGKGGTYLVGGSAGNPASGTVQGLQILYNNATYVRGSYSAHGFGGIGSVPVQLADGDFVELFAPGSGTFGSASALESQTVFWLAKIV